MKGKILLVDNFDSFTFNIFHYLKMTNFEVDVIRNDDILFLDFHNYDAIVISPGPGLPEEAGDLMTFIKLIPDVIPVLGVCLGMQALAICDNGELFNLNKVRHGISKYCRHNNSSLLFNEINENFSIGLYHSWAVKEESILQNWIPTAHDEENILMAFEHKSLPRYGVQFHPESILTPEGFAIVANFGMLVSQRKLLKQH